MTPTQGEFLMSTSTTPRRRLDRPSTLRWQVIVPILVGVFLLGFLLGAVIF